MVGGGTGARSVILSILSSPLLRPCPQGFPYWQRLRSLPQGHKEASNDAGLLLPEKNGEEEKTQRIKKASYIGGHNKEAKENAGKRPTAAAGELLQSKPSAWLSTLIIAHPQGRYS